MHVLSLPPAFALSQDQTLKLKSQIIADHNINGVLTSDAPAFPPEPGERSETSVQRHTLTARSLDRTRKDMNKPPAFLFLDIHLSKSEEAYARGRILQLPTRHRPGCPARSAPSSAIVPRRSRSRSDRSRCRVVRPSGPWRLEPANRPVNRRSGRHIRDTKDSDRPIQSPGSAVPLKQSRRPPVRCSTVWWAAAPRR